MNCNLSTGLTKNKYAFINIHMNEIVLKFEITLDHDFISPWNYKK